MNQHIIIDEDVDLDEDMIPTNIKNNKHKKKNFVQQANKSAVPTNVYKNRDSAWDRYAKTDGWACISIFTEKDTYDLTRLVFPHYKKPSGQSRARIGVHPFEDILLCTLCILINGCTNLLAECVFQMPSNFIAIAFERCLYALDAALDFEMQLLSDQEKRSAQPPTEFPDALYIVDGSDFPVAVHQDKWMFYSHKKNVAKQTGFRSQILIDRLYGYYRGCITHPCGINNDQKMLKESKWNKPNVLINDNEYLMADGGYFPTQHLNVLTPATEKQKSENNDLRMFNKTFNAERSEIERTFGQLQCKFSILAFPWRRKLELFPVCLRVCLKLMNRYWRLYGK